MSWKGSAKNLVPLALRKKLMDPVYGHFLFSRFEEVWFDSESWRMTTPEPVAKNLASHFQGRRVLDAFAGIGGNTIQFALAGNQVVAVDRSKKLCKYLKHNCEVYSVRGFVDVVYRDIFLYTKCQEANAFDVLYLDPPFCMLDDLLSGKEKRKNLKDLWSLAPRKVLKLPKDFDVSRLSVLGNCMIKKVFLNNTLFYLEAWFDEEISQGSGFTGLKEQVICPEVKHIFSLKEI
jgi:trimethylguanosine synthase